MPEINLTSLIHLPQLQSFKTTLLPSFLLTHIIALLCYLSVANHGFILLRPLSPATFDVTNHFVWGLGVPEDEVEFNDVYSLNDELLDMVPKPVLAVLFLFPYNDKMIWKT
ncbi:uncharacterized protein LOC120263679 [Dioscorea cayenensis subsp. rotundata]|uniref:ubiquitinyl hydrolase 1 n=1 Tax=Dioscorea cayennensis subsp. rotundata TaxID=55577 RepID=A0AB40BJK4_DIOCR|nr:uncharacterized protein LOC120263679 [Dioscorea cayenensis subsp. rotundata]